MNGWPYLCSLCSSAKAKILLSSRVLSGLYLRKKSRGWLPWKRFGFNQHFPDSCRRSKLAFLLGPIPLTFRLAPLLPVA